MIEQYLFNMYAGLGVILALGMMPYLIKDDLELKAYRVKMKMKYTYGIETDDE